MGLGYLNFSETSFRDRMAATDALPQFGDDADLVKAIASGEEGALKELYARYSSGVYGLCVKMLHTPAEAEEALQDVFVRAWKLADRFDPERAKCFTWLIMMARSICLDRLRARKSRPVASDDPLEESDKLVAFDEDTRYRVVLRERADEVRRKLKDLPYEQQLCIELAFFRGHTQSEIAELLSEPLGTIKARIRRGLLKMRELLQST